MSEQNNGKITVELTENDVKHLMKHGTSNVSKEVGPLDIRIKFSGKVWLDVTLEDAGGTNNEVIAQAEVDDA